MNLLLLLLASFASLLLLLLVWVLRDPKGLTKSDDDLTNPDELGRRHMTFYPQVRQAMSAEDFSFLASRGSHELARRVRKERQRVSLAYLSSLRGEFLKLWRLAREIASMAPQVVVAQEFARLRLGLSFSFRYELIRIKLLVGSAPIPELGSLSEFVSRLAIRLETAMNDLGERAALAAKLASALDGRRLNTP